MQERIEEDRRYVRARYVPSKRHTMQVDFDDYLRDLTREMRRGEKRARVRQKPAERAFRERTGSLRGR
jgi:hypothetical protein